MIRKFNPEGVTPHPFYSHGVEIDGPKRLVYLAGQVGARADGSLGEDIGEQTRIAMDNVKSVLAAAGMDFSNIVKSTIYLVDQDDYEGFVTAGGPLLPSPPAATTLLYVKALAAPALRIEIDVVAAE